MATDWSTAPVPVGYEFDPFCQICGSDTGYADVGAAGDEADVDDDDDDVFTTHVSRPLAGYSFPWHIGLKRAKVPKAPDKDSGRGAWKSMLSRGWPCTYSGQECGQLPIGFAKGRLHNQRLWLVYEIWRELIGVQRFYKTRLLYY